MNPLHLLIDGQLVAGDLDMDVINPATEALLCKSPRASKRQLDAAIAAAKKAFPGWRATPMASRAALLEQVAQRLEANVDELARLLTQEQGKPLADARGEVLGSALYFRHFSKAQLPVQVIEHSDSRHVEAHRLPLGVVAAIVPWNFPLILMAFKLPAALVAGNTVLLKPAASTPLTTLRFGELVADLFPPGVLNIITDANDLGAAITAHPDVRKVSFTGSTETGKRVMAGAADTLKRLTLELGGNDAAIVLDDVDVKSVAGRVFKAGFANSGQVCIAIKRLYVQDGVYDAVCDELARLANEVVVGDGLAPDTQYGPLQNKAQYEKVKGFIEDARHSGNIIAGGSTQAGPGYFIRPTVVRDIAEGSRLVDEEQFGPILPVIRFTDPDDAVARANNSPYGLGSSIWSSNAQRAYRLAEMMDAGTVWVNKHRELAPGIPFGGCKFSGMGTELGERGLEEFTQLKVINIAA